MAFYNNTQNNQKDNQVNTNTRGYQFMNKNGFDPSTLTFGFWNEMITLKINPALEPSKQTDNKVFDYEKNVSTSLTLEKAMLLLYKIEKEVMPALTKGEDKTIGIQVGGDSLICVGTGKKLTNEIKPFFAIYKSLNQDTKKPEMSIFYEFKTNDTIDDYDEKAGTYAISSGIPSEFMLFIELLKSAIVGLSNSTAHSMRTVNRWNNDKVNNTLSSIAQKVGAESAFNNNRGGYVPRSNSVNFGSSNSSSSSNDTSNDAEISMLDNIEDINSYLN